MASIPQPRWLHDDSTLARIFLAFLATAGLFYVNILPALVDGLVKGRGFSTAEAGSVASSNIYGAAVGAFVIIPMVARLAWRRWSAILLVGLIAIDAASLLVERYQALLAIRFFHGLIGGALVGIGFAVIGRTKVPDRAFGALLVIQFGMGGLALAILPTLTQAVGVSAPFWTLIGFSALTLALLPFIPEFSIADSPTTTKQVSGNRSLVVFALVAVFLFQATNTVFNAFVIGFGDQRGVSSETIGATLATANWLGAAASALVLWCGTRFGRLFPILLGTVVAIVGTALFWWNNTPAFVAANLVTGALWAFILPFLFGLSVAAGNNDRISAIVGFCSKMGLATGPLVGGIMLHQGNYRLLLWTMIGGLLLAAFAAAWPASLIDQKDSI